MAEKPIILTVVCAQCGAEFGRPLGVGRPKRFCSANCRYAARQHRHYPCTVDECTGIAVSRGLCAKHYHRERAGRPLVTMCENCGDQTSRPRFCSIRCSNLVRDRKNGVRPFSEIATKARDCLVCGRVFRRWKRGEDDALKCCSRECGFELMRIRGAISRFIQAEKAIYRKWARATAERARLALIEPLPPRMCKDCGKVELNKFKHFCPDCQARRLSENRARVIHKLRTTPEGKIKRKARRRTDKARRRAIERGVYAERFDPLEILARDGWRCHICGGLTPKRLRGTYDDRAPELDHIVPLSKGGQHTRQNTACACRRCNIVKSGEVRGQMLLFG